MECRTEQVSYNSQAFSQVMRIRETVFVKEQNVPAELEADEFDAEAVHILIFNESGAVATGRYFKDPEDRNVARLGRVAVLKPFRGKGYGKILTAELIKLISASGEFREIKIHSQSAVSSLYAGFGFVVTSSEFYEAGIPHVEMSLKINNSQK